MPFTENDQALFAEFQGKGMVIVLNKNDLPAKLDSRSLPLELQKNPMVSISAKYQTGLDALKETIHDLVTSRAETSTPPVFINRMRHKHSIEKAIKGISQAAVSLEAKRSLEFVSLDLRSALDSLGEVVGETTTEDLLDQIFAEFCIGK